MSASSSIAAAKRRRGGGANPPTPSGSTPRPTSAGNNLTPQQRALLLQQQQLMAQKTPPQVLQQANQTPVYNPNINTSNNNSKSAVQVVEGPNGVSIPLGPDGKPLHPGVLIMDHEKRISNLEKNLYSGTNESLRNLENNSVNIIIEEGESPPWEHDIGMLHLRIDELNSRVQNLELLKQHSSLQTQQTQQNNYLPLVNNSDLEEKVNLLEKQLSATKALLLKVQTFAMETNTMLLKYSNLFEQQNQVQSTQDRTSLNVHDDSEIALKAWVEAGALALQTNELEELSTAELDKELNIEENTEEDAVINSN